MGKEEGQAGNDEGSSSQESHFWSEADEPSSAEEVVGNGEGTLGCCKEGWRDDSVGATSVGEILPPSVGARQGFIRLRYVPAASLQDRTPHFPLRLRFAC